VTLGLEVVVIVAIVGAYAIGAAMTMGVWHELFDSEDSVDALGPTAAVLWPVALVILLLVHPVRTTFRMGRALGRRIGGSWDGDDGNVD
jgi:hypothetical protein